MALDILITGGTGYVGRHLIPRLIARGHRVRVLARAESVQRVPEGAAVVVGDALDPASVGAQLSGSPAIPSFISLARPIRVPAKRSSLRKWIVSHSRDCVGGKASGVQTVDLYKRCLVVR